MPEQPTATDTARVGGARHTAFKPTWAVMDRDNLAGWSEHVLSTSKTAWRWRPSKVKDPGPAMLFFPASGYYSFQSLRPPYFSESIASCATLIELADAIPGVSILVVEYPVYQTGQCQHPDALHAAMSVLTWVRKQPGVDESRICLAGASSGAHLALALALSCHEKAMSPPIQCLVIDAPGLAAYVPMANVLEAPDPTHGGHLYGYFAKLRAEDALHDPYVNPHAASDAALAALPRTLFIETGNDIYNLFTTSGEPPAFDCINGLNRFFLRMLELNPQHTVRIYPEGVHAAAWQHGSHAFRRDIAQDTLEWLAVAVNGEAPAAHPADTPASSVVSARSRSCLCDLTILWANALDALQCGERRIGTHTSFSMWELHFLPVLRSEAGFQPCLCMSHARHERARKAYLEACSMGFGTQATDNCLAATHAVSNDVASAKVSGDVKEVTGGASCWLSDSVTISRLLENASVSHLLGTKPQLAEGSELRAWASIFEQPNGRTALLAHLKEKVGIELMRDRQSIANAIAKIRRECEQEHAETTKEHLW